MTNCELVNLSGGDYASFEMWRSLDSTQRDYRNQLVRYVALIMAAGIISFAFLMRISGLW